MSIKDYAVDHDQFEAPATLVIQHFNGDYCFPCCCCIHNAKPQDADPCEWCGHNVNAETPNMKAEAEE